MTDDQLIESLRARTWPGDCEAAAFRLEELRARVAELEALPGNVLAQRVENLEAQLKVLREQEPVGIVDEGDDGVFADLETTNGVLVKLGDKLYARPVPAKPVNQSRPLESIESSELRLELHLRAGPRYQCQSKDCKSYEDGPGQFDTCPGCARKGYLCGSFVLDKNSTQYQQWVERTRDKYRGKSGQKNQSPEAGG